MSLTKAQAIEEVCDIVGLAYRSIGDYSEPCDCFCRRQDAILRSLKYANSGKTLGFVRRAVMEKLAREGHAIAKGFDPKTGRSI